jgi:hypothetical protein
VVLKYYGDIYMGGIRNNGLYLLPDGTQLVARDINGKEVFYKLESYDKGGKPEYSLDWEGNLRKNGKATGLCEHDLKWTGRSAW